MKIYHKRRKISMKKTLNMPKSGFPMRAGLPMREPDMLKHWE